MTESDRMVIRLKWLFDNYRLKLTDCELRSRPMVLLWIVCFFCKKIIPLYLRDIIFNNFKFSVNFWCKILNVETKFQRWKTRNRLWLALSFCYNIQKFYNNLIEVLMGRWSILSLEDMGTWSTVQYNYWMRHVTQVNSIKLILFSGKFIEI